jgi:hypothetical protein
MIDLAFDGTDIVFDEAGNLTTVEDAAAVAQRIYLTLKAQAGDWFLDTAFGQPWRESVLVRNPNLIEINSLLRVAISGVEGVIRILSFDLSFDRVTGRLSLTFEVATQYGVIAAQSEGDDVAAIILALMLQPVGGIA